jgi:tripartite-type tricarboxylate transporter receptor subunit TctC
MKAALRPFVLVVLVLLTGIAKADNWPTRPIKFVVPFGPGIGIDIMARTVAERLSRKLGQPVIVENIPGAGNILGRRPSRVPRRTVTRSCSPGRVPSSPISSRSNRYPTIRIAISPLSR